MRTVEIGKGTYFLRSGLRPLFVFEKLTGKPFEGKTLEETFMLLHSMLLASNDDYFMTFEELIDACEKDENIFKTFMAEIEDDQKRSRAGAEDSQKKK